MNKAILEELRRLSDDRCDYCRMPRKLDPLPFQVDHIIAQQHGGQTVLENLAWSCLHDNKHKGSNIAGIDPVTNQLTALFHPRRQSWKRHFAWNGAILVGRTQIARATIRVLAINDPDQVALRAELMEEGVFFFIRPVSTDGSMNLRARNVGRARLQRQDIHHGYQGSSRAGPHF